MLAQESRNWFPAWRVSTPGPPGCIGWQIDLLESIPGLFKRLQIRAQIRRHPPTQYPPPPSNVGLLITTSLVLVVLITTWEDYIIIGLHTFFYDSTLLEGLGH